jgi:hypothetical protein
MITAPIALFVYNRPVHMRRTIEALQRNELAEESDLFIFSDAPKTLEATEAVCKVREYIKTITGFRSVSILERDKNWGLANSIIDGVSRLCNEYGRVIVLEDDLLPSAYFLEYMNNALDRYEGDSRVMQVSGHMFPVDLDVSTDALFLPITTTWGWATWRRAWARFDPDMGNYERLMSDPEMIRRFDLDGAYPCLTMLESVRAGKIDAWGIRWYLSVFMNDGLVLFPAKSLIENKGFDAEGTNCGPDSNSVLMSQPTSVFRVRNFPPVVLCYEAAFRILKKYLSSVSGATGLLTRILNKILRAIPTFHWHAGR